MAHRFGMRSDVVYPLLVRNIEDGNLERVKTLITDNPRWKGNQGETGYDVLCEAFRHNKNKIARLLLCEGANANSISGERSYTPLHYATLHANMTMIRLLVAKGADVNAKNSDGSTALHYATKARKISIVVTLIKHGAIVDMRDNLDRTPLEYAIINGNIRIVKTLLQNKADVKARNSHGSTMLHTAVSYGHANIIELLMEHIDINVELTCDDSPLYIAIQKNFTEIAEYLLKQGASANSVSPYWRRYTPLHIACEHRLTNIIELLLSKGADVNAVAQYSITPIFLAVTSSNHKMAKLLLDHGANPNTEDKDGNTILYLATKRKDLDMVNEILSHSPDINNPGNQKSLAFTMRQQRCLDRIILESLLHYGMTAGPEGASDPELFYIAVENRYVKIVADLLKHGAEPNNILKYLYMVVRTRSREMITPILEYGFDINATDIHGNKALHYVALLVASHFIPDVRRNCTRTDLAKFLLGKGANPNAKTKTGLATLHLVIENEYVDLVQVLLEHGADVNLKTEIGVIPFYVADKEDPITRSLPIYSKSKFNTQLAPLHLAVQNGNKLIASALLGFDADVNVKNINGATPLHFAVHKGSHQMSSLLIIKRADVNAKYKGELTPLHLAIQSGNEDIVSTLLKYDAEVNMRTDLTGATPILLAAQRGLVDICTLLIRRGADVYAKYNSGFTTIHAAAMFDHERVIEMMLDLDVDINARDNDGNTALHWASKLGRRKAVRVLTANGADLHIVNKFNETAFDVADTAHICRSNVGYIYANDRPDPEDGFIYKPTNYIYDKWQNYCHYDSTRTFCCSEIVDKVDRHFKCSAIKQFLIRMIIAAPREEMYRVNVKPNMGGSRKMWFLPVSELAGNKTFVTKCKEEITELKSTKIDHTNIALYDILTNCMNEIAVYVKNLYVVQYFYINKNLKAKFPIYADVMRCRFERGKMRRTFLDKACKCLRSCDYFRFKDIPEHCVEKILLHVDNADLKSLQNSLKCLSQQ